MKRTLLAITTLIFLTIFSYGFYLYNKPHHSIAEDAPAYKLEAKTLISDYESNENIANSKYLGKIVELHGVIAEKTIDDKGTCNVVLQGQDISGVQCSLQSNAYACIKSLKEGQEIIIKGICTGMLMDVVLVDCVCVD